MYLHSCVQSDSNSQNPEGCTEESNFRSVLIADLGGSTWSGSVADLSGCGEGVRVCVVRQLSLAAFSFPSPADAPDDMRRHPPAQAPAGACSAVGIAKVEGEMCEVDPAVPGLCKVGPAVTGLCEVDPAVSGLCEVGPAKMGLARSASCRSEGGLVLEPGRKGGCALLLGDGRGTSGLKVYWHGPRAQWLRTPRPALSVRQVWWKPAVV